MFIRFVCGEIDSDSQVPAGIFCAAYDLLWSGEVSYYDYYALMELREWFNEHLNSPFQTGYVHYEDDVQVFARPYDDVRLLIRRTKT